jgi:hypothetical protein
VPAEHPPARLTTKDQICECTPLDKLEIHGELSRSHTIMPGWPDETSPRLTYDRELGNKQDYASRGRNEDHLNILLALHFPA